MFEIGLFLLVERFLGPGCRGGRYHVDKSVGMLVDKADAFVTGFGGDQHDDTQVVTVGYGFVVLHIVGKRQVGDNHAVDARSGTLPAKVFKTVLHDGVQVTHQDKRDGYLVADTG